MATTQELLTKLQAARATGVLKVRTPDGAELTYRSLDEMDRVIADLTRQASGGTRRTHVNPTFDRGL